MHGTLVITPKGGATRVIVLDDPELTIVVGPPESGFNVQQITNSAADMAVLLTASDDANRSYELGLADPFTTGSTDRAETHLFFPGGPGTTQVAGNTTDLLPPLGNDPPPNPFPEGGGGGNGPQPVLVLDLNENLIVEHDHTLEVQVEPGIDDTDAPFPIDLGDLDGFDAGLVIGQASDGDGPDDDPFVSTAGSSGPVLITVEPSFDGVYSGLDVTNGGQIFLFKEFTDGEQVVVGREGGADGPIAFIIFVTPDGQALWVQELLPIHHTDPADSPSEPPISNDPNSIASILNDALLVRGTLIGTSLTQTVSVGQHIVFVDDAPDAVDDDLQQLTEDAAAIGGNVIDPEFADDANDSGQDDPGTDGATLTHVNLPGPDGFVLISSGTEGPAGVYSFVVAGIGTYTFQANGAWTFDPVLNQNPHPVDASFSYRLTDGDGDFDDATQPISVLDGADPTGGKLGLAVEEPDLDTTLDGDTGTTSAGTDETDSGSLSFTAGSDDVTDFEFAETGGIVVQGLLGDPTVTWTVDITGALIGKIDGIDAIKLELSDLEVIEAGTSDSITVTATLLDDFPHALLGADSILIGGIQVKASQDDGDFAIGQVRVRVLDDVPIALSDSEGVQLETALATVNALFILDKSGSMGSDGDPGSRISLAKAAILDFAGQPNVLSVCILPFDSSGGTASAWFDVSTPEGFAALEAFLDPITGGGSTNYVDALSDAQQAWTTTPPPNNDADLQNVYFVSDGAPDTSLSNAQITAWETFLGANVDNAYAVGIGTGVNDGDLQDVAWPNNPDETNNVIVIDSAEDLGATLVATAQGSVTIPGNVIDSSLDDDLFGADGPGFVKTLRWDSDGSDDVDDADAVGYRFDGTDIYLNNVLFDDNAFEITFTTVNGGEMYFNFLTGGWEYTTPDTVDAAFDENFAYTIVDDDGDESAPATLDITVSPPPPTYALTGAPDVTEGNALIFTLTLSHASSTDTVFELATLNGSATGGSDFETTGFRYRVVGDLAWINATNGDEVTIPAGETAIEIEVNTSDDGLDEPNNETMQLVVQSVVSGSVAAVANDDDEIGQIDDNDTPPTLSISNGTTSALLASAAGPLIAPVVEGAFAYFQLKLSSASGTDIVVRLDTDNGDDGGSSPGGNQSDADGGSDHVVGAFEYSLDGGTTWLTEPDDRDVRIPAGTTAILVRIETINDGTFESLEAFRVDFSGGGAGIISGSAILDDSGQAPDGGFGSDGEIQIADDDVEILGDGSYDVPENTTLVADLEASSGIAGALTWSIVNTPGTDFDKFGINSSTGLLSFLAAPDFENPTDIGGNNFNNIYVVEVQVSNGQDTDVESIAVTVTNAPSVNNDTVITNINDPDGGDDNETIAIPTLALLLNDVGLAGETLSVTSVQNASNLVDLDLVAGFVTAVDALNGGSFQYTGTTSVSGETDTATVSINRAQAGQQQLDGTSSADILLGRDGTFDLIIAGDGDDVIIGGTGADDLQFNNEQHGLDHVLDFEVGIDDLVIDISGFGGGFETAGNDLATGANVTLYAEGSDRTTAGDGVRFFYDKDAGDNTIWFDQTAGAGQNWVALAKLENGVDISGADIHLIA
jgi:hypothetical protein